MLDHQVADVPHGSVHPRHVIEVEAGTRLTLVELHEAKGDHLTNVHTDISIGENASVTHVKLLAEAGATHFAGVNATLLGGATYDAFAPRGRSPARASCSSCAVRR